MYILYPIPYTASCHLYVIHVSLATLNNATFMFTYPTLLISYIYTVLYTIYCILPSLCHTCITSHFKLCHFYVYIPYVTHLICIYCTRYHLLHLAYAVLYHHSFIYLYVHILHPFTLTCVYKVVVVELLG